MKRAGNQPVSPRNELKTLKERLGGRNRLDFGTVRPRVQIPGPRPVSTSKSTILERLSESPGTARVTDSKWFRYVVATTAQFPAAVMCLRAHAGGSLIQPKRAL